MNELSRHIEILLLNNDCIIVPDLGGFVAHHVDAQYDENDGVFYPPKRTIGFNPQLKINDHLLVQSYIEAYDISYPEALSRIEDAVAELKQHLENEGEYEFNDLGTLYLNPEGHYQFVPCESGLLTPSLYGLAFIKMPPISEQQKQQETTNVVAMPTEKKTAETAGTPDAAETIIIKMSWVRNVAVVAAAIIMFFFVSSPVENAQYISDIQESTILPISHSAKHDGAAEASLHAKGQSATPHQEEAVESELPVSQTTGYPAYTIVIASKTLLRHAERYTEDIVASGYSEAFIQKMSNSDRYRVVYGRYHTEKDAQNALRALRLENSPVFKDAWVLETKDM